MNVDYLVVTHKPCMDIDACGIELKPSQELDPMYLCLCPNCRMKYIRLRNDSKIVNKFIESISVLTESEISGVKPIEIPVGSETVWFAHTHVGEIRELLLLKAKCPETTVIQAKVQDARETDDTPVHGDNKVNMNSPTMKTLSGTKKVVHSFEGVKLISMDDITTGHKVFVKPSQDKVDALIAYYKKNGCLDKPIVVSCNDDKYLLEDKYLRYYVAKLLKLKEIHARFKISDGGSLENKLRSVGTRVIHTQFGKGRVIKSDLKFVTIKFESGAEKRLDIELCINNKILSVM